MRACKALPGAMDPAADPFDMVRNQVKANLSAAERTHQKWGEARRRKPVRHDECKMLLLELTQAL